MVSSVAKPDGASCDQLSGALPIDHVLVRKGSEPECVSLPMRDLAIAPDHIAISIGEGTHRLIMRGCSRRQLVDGYSRCLVASLQAGKQLIIFSVGDTGYG
jgi:hypothetical protein